MRILVKMLAYIIGWLFLLGSIQNLFGQDYSILKYSISFQEDEDANGNNTMNAAGSAYLFEDPCVIDNSITTNGNTITANQTGALYQWIDCKDSSLIVGATTAIFTPTTNGNYAVIITLGSCSDTSNCVSLIVSGVEENGFRNEISIYPNPTNGNVNIDLGSLKGVHISIHNAIGQEVYSIVTGTQSQLEISLTDYSEGVFFIKVQNGNSHKEFKLVNY